MRIRRIKWHSTKTEHVKPHGGVWVLVHIKKLHDDWYTVAQWDPKYGVWCTRTNDYWYDVTEVCAWASIPKEDDK